MKPHQYPMRPPDAPGGAPRSRSRFRKKLVHEGEYAAEVEVEPIETEEGWSPYLSLVDAEKLDRVRVALRRGDIGAASDGCPVQVEGMKPEIYWVPGPWPGRLAILPRPRGGDWLPDEVRIWREAGLNVVTSLLTREEVAELELRDEEVLAREQGLEFHTFPIPDRGVPESRVRTADLIRVLEKALASGRNVAVHCRQGVGRSALIAASLLASAGQDAEQAFLRIEDARGAPVPDTAAQREWVKETALQAPAVVVHRR